MTSMHEEMMTVRLAGAVSQGAAIDTSVAGALVSVPRGKVDADDLVFRAVRGDLQELGIERGDLLIVEPRPDGNAATAELVLTLISERAFVGRWWAKHGRRSLLDHALQTIADGAELRVLGAITVVLRASLAQSRRTP